ncbi:SirB2 family protein [Denitrificimonas caeni]|uniref:SirB2 family protein n=1 Tax=Denitrificimonas caeni TaxID=521720 RepID=UPI0019643C96|nr:SirB2 family protein [Denitrificimonas caeni]
MFAEHYLLVKNIHIALVLLSGSLFVLRGLWVLLAGTGTALQRQVNRLSYVIDSLLLLAALLLLIILNFTPLSASWLQTKLLLLVLYVLFGVFAFRTKYSMRVRWLAYIAALLCYAGMYYSARLHQPFAGLVS